MFVLPAEECHLDLRARVCKVHSFAMDSAASARHSNAERSPATV